MHLAVGTSFAIIIPTSMVSVYTHNKHKSVDPNIVKTYGLFVIIGVLLEQHLLQWQKQNY